MKMIFSKNSKILWLVITLIILFLLFIGLINLWVYFVSQKYIYSDIENVPASEIALVFDVSISNMDEINSQSKDMLKIAADLYKAEKVKDILISPAFSASEYWEVGVVKSYLLELGVSPEAISVDHEGMKIYTSLHRARDLSHIESLIIITQDFQIRRAVYIARKLGIEAYGLSLTLQSYKNIEILENIKAFFGPEKTYIEAIP